MCNFSERLQPFNPSKPHYAPGNFGKADKNEPRMEALHFLSYSALRKFCREPHAEALHFLSCFSELRHSEFLCSWIRH